MFLLKKRESYPNCGSKERLKFVSATFSVPIEARARVTAIAAIPWESLPSFLLQAVFVPGEKTGEGLIVEAVALPFFDIIEFLKRNPNGAYELSPRKWEEMVATAFKKAGYDIVTLTPRSGDPGRPFYCFSHTLST